MRSIFDVISYWGGWIFGMGLLIGIPLILLKLWQEDRQEALGKLESFEERTEFWRDN